jgi:hypothetical protein
VILVHSSNPGILVYATSALVRITLPKGISKTRAKKILTEADIVDRNPVRDTAPASEKEGQRDVYISFQDFQKITEYCPCWAYHLI